MTDNFTPTFDVSQALEFAKCRKQRGLTEEERNIWIASLKELRDDLQLQLKRQNFSSDSLNRFIL